ncbi:MAG: enoyl-CoA hydratase [Cytophagales bacterium]|nr:MAG: enoyl-CoA hydratase [Cytophagales bacterium]TAF61624.1 MAG: enoyl-CoA hydratase [Cytophagales bacterium]
MQFDNLLLNLQDGVLTITINREKKLNALNIQTIEELGKAFDYVYDTADVKAVILTGAGEKAFVAGADISEIAALTDINARKFVENGQNVFAKIENCPKLVIAAINGFALGGGCELAMACHLRVAAESARFGQPEVNLGVIPGYGGTQRLPILIGKTKALELILTGDIIAAEEALSLGLVNYAVPPAELLTKCKEIIAKVLTKAPPAVANAISCVNAVYHTGVNGYQAEANAFANCCKTQDFKEGTAAFLEKRKPVFKGK